MPGGSLEQMKQFSPRAEIIAKYQTNTSFSVDASLKREKYSEGALQLIPSDSATALPLSPGETPGPAAAPSLGKDLVSWLPAVPTATTIWKAPNSATP
jgi:hypothetical protein